MTEAEQQTILNTLKEHILADPNVEFGPLTVNQLPDWPGIWIQIAGHEAYLGASYEAALLTAQLSDWWVLSRDGKLLDDDREWFETRATLGKSWEEKELRMFKEERRMRLALNISIATRDKLDNQPEN